MNQELFFLSDNGEVIRANIFKPLLRSLAPACIANAEEIHIAHSQSEPKHISAEYSKDGKGVPLNIEAGFPWADVFVRLKIIAGMSITQESHQTGEIAIRLKDRVMRFFIEIAENDKQETILLKQTTKS
jgi:hypothetical protein